MITLPYSRNVLKQDKGKAVRYFGGSKQKCCYTECSNNAFAPSTTLRLFCCKEHRLLARGSKKGKRVAARMERRKHNG
jgi:hypothetical protein